MCFVAIFPMPYGYYMFLRWAVSLTTVGMAIALPRTGYWGVAFVAVAIAILFNPIVKIPLGRDAWKWFDAGAGILFLFFCMVLAIHRIRASPSSETAEAITVLEEIGAGFDAAAFGHVSVRVRALILTDPEEFGKMIRRGTPVRRWVWGAISNAAGDLVESGEFHIYRGVLNPIGPGDGLVRIFDAAADEMVRLNAAEPEFIAKQKASLRKNIKDVG